jgi:hypothetical protein
MSAEGPDASKKEAQFNPYGLLAVHVPLALIKYNGVTKKGKSLSWGARVFYARLAFFLGKPNPKGENFCSPDLKEMRKAMGTSIDTIGRWLEELTEHGFIKRVRRGRGPAKCEFVRHPCLNASAAELLNDSNSAEVRNQSDDSDSAKLRNQDGLNSAELRNQDENSIPQSPALDSATLPVQFRNSAAPIPQLCGSLIRKKTIQENSHENIQENDSNNDVSADSRKGDANADTDDVGLLPEHPETEPEKTKTLSHKAEPKPESETKISVDREMLSNRIAEHMGRRIPLTGELEHPADSLVDVVLKILGPLPVNGFCKYLRNLPAKYQTGGKSAPLKFEWFVTTAQNYANMQTPQAPTQDRCRHGLPYGVCCNTEAENDRLTASFDTTDQWPPAQGGAA